MKRSTLTVSLCDFLEGVMFGTIVICGACLVRFGPSTMGAVAGLVMILAARAGSREAFAKSRRESLATRADEIELTTTETAP